MKKSMRSIGIGVFALSIVGCATETVEPVDEALAEHNSTCLKNGFAANTKAHSDCVIALHQKKMEYQKSLQEAIAPAPVEVAPAESKTTR